MQCYDKGGFEEQDSGLTSIALPENSNFISPTVQIRTVKFSLSYFFKQGIY